MNNRFIIWTYFWHSFWNYKREFIKTIDCHLNFNFNFSIVHRLEISIWTMFFHNWFWVLESIISLQIDCSFSNVHYESWVPFSPCHISNKAEFLFSDRKIQNKTFRIFIFHFVNFRILSRLCKFSVKILFFVILSTLYAQEPSRSTPTESNKETSGKNGGIVVQGKKDRRDLEIFKTPSSISRFNEQDILDTGISRTNDIDKQVPNFAIIDSGARNFTYYNIRGMRSTLFSDPSVGIILDGVPLADNVALNTELFALESIEVLV